MRVTQFAAVAALSLIGGQAAAEGFYAGGAIGKLSLEADSFGIDMDDTAFKVFGGYAINDNFAVELAYIDGGTPEDTIFINGVAVNIEADPSAIQASIIGTLPVSDAFGLYLRAALLSWEFDVVASTGFSSGTGTSEGEDFSWGIGGKINLGAKGEVRLEYEGADVEATDIRILTVAGLIRF